MTHVELFERMFAESRFVVIRANWIGGEKLLAAIEPHLPDDLLLVFSARITMLPFPRTGMGDADFDFIDAIINLFLRDGDPGTLEILTRPQLPGRSVHLLPAVESLLRAAHAKNKAGRGRIRYFPGLADIVPLLTAESVPVSDYCQRLCERAEELGAQHVLWLETPLGVTEQSWRKPDINSPDVVHQRLRTTVHDRAELWTQSARLAAQQSDQPAEALAVANAANRVSVARFQVHHVSRDGGSPLYESLQDWWPGDFAIPGPLPAGLAELAIHRVGQIREVFGNYDHLLVRVVGPDDRRDDQGDSDFAPAPGSLPKSIDQGQLNKT
ncbi:MAG: hypothetical protein HYV60_13960 [Planctomycetia bacterium]|nr:hypothetical protein [Planctomycetia bacterium]